MAKYKKRKDGRYATTICTQQFDDSGKPVRKKIYARTIAELEAKAAAARTDISRGTYADDKGKSFGEYADLWLKIYKSGTALKTYQKYEHTVKVLLADLRTIQLKDITRKDIQCLLTAKEDHPDCQRMIRLVVRSVLETAIDDGLLYKNVARNIRLKAHKAQEKRPLTDWEKKILDTVQWTPMEAAYLTILRHFGLRSGEALGLMKNDIDPEGECIHVRRSLSFAGSVSKLKEPKSSAGTRDVDAPEGVLSRLLPYVQSCPSLYLFHGNNGDLMSHSSYKRFWSGIYKKIDGASGHRESMEPIKLTPHIFRHSYTCALIDADVSVKEAQRLLGHSSVSVTLDIYAHHTTDARAKTKAKLKKLGA